MKNPLVFRILSVALFIFGVLLGLVFNGLAVWADFEAVLFDASRSADRPLDDLRCPIAISPAETGVIRLDLDNPTDRPVRTLVRTHISGGYVTLFREDSQRVSVEPGKSTPLSWEVTADDAVWNRFILARVYQVSAFPLPARTATCGILLVDFLGLPGLVIVSGVIGLSAAGMLGGIWLWQRSHKPLRGVPLNAFYSLCMIALFVGGGIVLIVLGNSLLAGVLLLTSVLLVVSVNAYFLMRL